MPEGTTTEATVVRVVDGDTIRVTIPNHPDEESLRILALDTEESHAGGSKPVTPLGHKAKARAEQFFQAGDTVLLKFPGDEPLNVCLTKYRGNFGRLLLFVHMDNEDFQETMIREGFSPYFTKYGNASFEDHHERYRTAERSAQAEFVGIWDQIGENGSEIRNYAALSTWWSMRAQVIDEYRELKASTANGDLLNSRLDFEEIKQRAESGDTVTVFTELREILQVRQNSAIVRIGSIQQPFAVFIPDVFTADGEDLVNILRTRYIAEGEDHPRRSYAYVTGELSLFRDSPQITVTDPAQVTDEMPA